MIKAIIFDCFGVLVGRGFDETYRIAGGDPVKDHEFIVELLGLTNRGLISEDEFHDRLTSQLNISLEDYRQAVLGAEQPNRELLGYIAELHRVYKTAILSNANVGVLERKLDPSTLEADFDVLIVSGELGVVKPDPEIYSVAAEKLDVAPQDCVFTDDHIKYCQAAEAIGMQTIQYKNYQQFKSDLKRLFAKQR